MCPSISWTQTAPRSRFRLAAPRLRRRSSSRPPRAQDAPGHIDAEHTGQHESDDQDGAHLRVAPYVVGGQQDGEGDHKGGGHDAEHEPVGGSLDAAEYRLEPGWTDRHFQVAALQRAQQPPQLLRELDPEPRQIEASLANRATPPQRREMAKHHAPPVRHEHCRELEARVQPRDQALVHEHRLQEERIAWRQMKPVAADDTQDVIDDWPNGDLPHRPAVLPGAQVLDVAYQRDGVDVMTSHAQ